MRDYPPADYLPVNGYGPRSRSQYHATLHSLGPTPTEGGFAPSALARSSVACTLPRRAEGLFWGSSCLKFDLLAEAGQADAPVKRKKNGRYFGLLTLRTLLYRRQLAGGHALEDRKCKAVSCFLSSSAWRFMPGGSKQPKMGPFHVLLARRYVFFVQLKTQGWDG